MQQKNSFFDRKEYFLSVSFVLAFLFALSQAGSTARPLIVRQGFEEQK